MNEQDYEFTLCVVCGGDVCVCDGETCPECGGAGFISTCWDDLCHGEMGCIHGDGNIDCNECGSDGIVYPRKVSEDEYLKLKSKDQIT